MGMFDWYHPLHELSCPVCGSRLGEWQGKDGPNGLFVWKQGNISPIEQKVSADCQLPFESLRKWRLPDKFEIYSYDCAQHGPITAQCYTVNGAWSETKIVRVGSK